MRVEIVISILTLHYILWSTFDTEQKKKLRQISNLAKVT